LNAVSLVEFRKNAGGLLKRVKRGQSLLLTVRGKAVARLAPVEVPISEEDPLYRLAELATDDGKTLSNRDMDRLVYEA